MNDILILQAGGTLNPRRHVYIERPADDRLFALLRKGRYVNVLSSRQMGKSSLMVRTAHRLGAEGVRVIVVDLAAEIGVAESADAYYLGLLNKISRDLKLTQPLEPWWNSLVAETANQRLLRFFRELAANAVTGSLVFFLTRSTQH